MTFEEYVDLIVQSVAGEGYDAFLPCMCIPGEAIEIKVLQCDLSSEGEEDIAKDWMAAFDARRKFLAYRSGNGHVDVCEFIEDELSEKREIQAASPEESWRELLIEGELVIQIPKSATHDIQDDGRMLVIRLATEPVTEVLLGSYPMDESSDVAGFLKGELERFINDCIIPRVPGEVVYNVMNRTNEDWADQTRHFCQGVLSLPDGRQWMARTVTYPGQEGFYLIHWNGPKSYILDPVTRIIDSLQWQKTPPPDRPDGGE